MIRVIISTEGHVATDMLSQPQRLAFPLKTRQGHERVSLLRWRREPILCLLLRPESFQREELPGREKLLCATYRSFH